MTVQATRRTQEERRAQTRSALRQATIDCLVELGYARTTTAEVLARAGVSKGAMSHHFASKADLMLAAMDDLYAELDDRMRAQQQNLPSGPERVRHAVELLWSTFEGPLFPAAMELWTAARTDAALREALGPHERELGRQLRVLLRDMLGPALVDEAGFEPAYRLLLTSMRGYALSRPVRAARGEDVLVDDWVRIVTDLVGRPRT
ncbi:TetR/AcrR family transcriptional regulator [Spongisporangium articulatum]|uniref:TetR/AcrR family transcriptional regulator n=1 Tax=Spongisporangium articulatum TaxID=3362603 RepID=A0ABW8ALR0_9ACTN